MTEDKENARAAELSTYIEGKLDTYRKNLPRNVGAIEIGDTHRNDPSCDLTDLYSYLFVTPYRNELDRSDSSHSRTRNPPIEQSNDII